MLKLIGSLLILVASVGLAINLKTELDRHLGMLYDIRQLFVELSQESRYSMQPMEVILTWAAKKRGGPLCAVCDAIAQRLREKSGADGAEIWRSVFLAWSRELGLADEELQLAAEAGRAFFGKSMEENQKNLALCMERLDFIIETVRNGQKEKKKVYQTVSVLGGLMLVILLI